MVTSHFISVYPLSICQHCDFLAEAVKWTSYPVLKEKCLQTKLWQLTIFKLKKMDNYIFGFVWAVEQMLAAAKLHSSNTDS